MRMTLTRRFAIGLGVLACGTMALAWPLSASAISLRTTNVLTGNAILLGDIFEGLSSDADKVLAWPLSPGQNMVLNARTLMRIAAALDVPWQPSSAADTVTLSRAATIITPETMEAALAARLAQDKTMSGTYKIMLQDRQAKIIIPPDQPQQAEVTAFTVNPGGATFQATLAAPSAANPLQTLAVAGMIQRLVTVPVIREPMNIGTVIGVRDIETIKIPETELRTDTIVSAENLIGMTPRHLLSAGQPVKANDIEAPRIIKRGDIVTMVFRNDTLELTAQGKALEHGVKGDLIRVVNTGSNKTVQALVTAPQEVTVQTF